MQPTNTQRPWREITATYRDRCGICDERIQRGTRVAFRQQGWRLYSKWHVRHVAHLACAERVEAERQAENARLDAIWQSTNFS